MLYLDHAASTPMRPEAVAAMLPFLTDNPGNPSGSHAASRVSKTALEQAREDVATAVGCDAREVIFTGGGSESDNLAIKGTAVARRELGLDGVVTSGIEHKAVLGATQRLARDGFRVATVGATAAGVIDLNELSDALDAHTSVVSVMLVNNETGVVQPLHEVRALISERAPQAVLHTDAVQAPQWIDLVSATQPADLVSLSGHKFGGPKGVGVLMKRSNVALAPLIEGGGHELGLRAGTQNVAGIVAFAEALRITHAQRAVEITRIAALRDRLEVELGLQLEGFAVNGDVDRRVEGLLHASFCGVEAETMLLALDIAGLCAASGSACSSGAIDPSHVLIAMGMHREIALSSVRFSLGWASTDADIDAAIPVVVETVNALRTRAA